jgi:hypothetical protein
MRTDWCYQLQEQAGFAGLTAFNSALRAVTDGFWVVEDSLANMGVRILELVGATRRSFESRMFELVRGMF